MAAALKSAPVSAAPDADALATVAKDWKGAILSRSLPELSDKLAQKRALGRPKSAAPKASTTIRFDADVLAGLKATGRGWQTRVNDAMKDWLHKHTPSH